MRRAAAVLGITAWFLVGCGSRGRAEVISASSVRQAFLAKNIPVVQTPSMTFGSYRAEVVEFDPHKLLTPHLLRGQFLVIFVLPDTASRIRALTRPAMQESLKADGLLPIVRDNVVVTVARGAVTRRFIARVRAALAAATASS